MPGPARTRITAGEWRGRTVLTPRGTSLRPTTALVRQALFNILGERVVGASFLDLYAGAGTVGFEALSRGAASVTFVERDRAVIDLVRTSAERLGCADRCRLVAAEVVGWLRRASAQLPATDICYLDAPYRDDESAVSVVLIAATPPAMVVCEHHRARHLPGDVGGLRRVREASYGATRLTFWRREASSTSDAGDGQA